MKCTLTRQKFFAVNQYLKISLRRRATLSNPPYVVNLTRNDLLHLGPTTRVTGPVTLGTAGILNRNHAEKKATDGAADRQKLQDIGYG